MKAPFRMTFAGAILLSMWSSIIFGQAQTPIERSANDAAGSGDDAGNAASNALGKPASFAPRLLAMTDMVLQNHIDPPTRQQMILAGVQALHQADRRPAPQGLSARISELATRGEIADYLNSVFAEFSDLSNAERVLANGMLSALPCGARLIDADTNKIDQQLAANRYVGVGIALSMGKGKKHPAIPKVFYNGPAWKAGVKAGDLILEIDGNPTASKNLNQILEYSRGEEGTQVTFVVRQPDSKETRTVVMTRGRVFIPTVEGFREKSEGQWQYMVDAEAKIAYLRINRFGPSTLHELRQAAAKLRQEGLRGIILDLRYGGGLLHDTVMVADSLLDSGTIGHIKTLESVKKHEARPGALFQETPMAVLVARHTSSGNVFLTAALQDNKRAIVVGEPTAGQTFVRSILSIPHRDEKIVMATGLMLRGDGTTLLAAPSRLSPEVHFETHAAKHNKRPGFILPDHVVANNNRNGQPLSKDAVLAKAVKVLKDAAREASTDSKKASGGD